MLVQHIYRLESLSNIQFRKEININKQIDISNVLMFFIQFN